MPVEKEQYIITPTGTGRYMVTVEIPGHGRQVYTPTSDKEIIKDYVEALLNKGIGEPIDLVNNHAPLV
jgi:protoporphyrinogen oxidase